MVKSDAHCFMKINILTLVQQTKHLKAIHSRRLYFYNVHLQYLQLKTSFNS